jgi:hypothetical protein
MRAANPSGMHHAQELRSLTEAEIASVTGGFMQYLQQGLGIANQLVGQFGGDKAKQVMGAVSDVVPKIAGMFGGGGG